MIGKMLPSLLITRPIRYRKIFLYISYFDFLFSHGSCGVSGMNSYLMIIKFCHKNTVKKSALCSASKK